MAYTELTPSIEYTVTTEGTAWTVTNTTEYAASGSGTATFPSEDQTQAWYMWRASPFVVDEENIPSTQNGFPVTIGHVGPDGLKAPDNVNQFVLMIVPVGAVYATVLNDAYESGDAWTYLIEYAQTNGAVGQFAILLTTTADNCVNDARRILNNTFPAKCSNADWMQKYALQIGVVRNAQLGQAATIDSETSADFYAEAQAELDLLNSICSTPECTTCNC